MEIKIIITFTLLIFWLYLLVYGIKKKKINDNFNINKIKIKNNQNSLINENFFIIDSNNLGAIVPHMYGYSVSKNGFFTDNYYKQLGEYKEPSPEGVYIMIRKIGDEIIINQDYYGSIGLYIYENKAENYFALSNSFLLLEKYLSRKQKISLNRNFADSLIVTNLCTFSIDETLIKEIKQIHPNAFVIINIKTNELKMIFKDNEENTIPLESEEGLKLIDKWIDKWCYIFRSLKKQINNISADLSGGFDSRILLSVLLNSGIDMNEIRINTMLDSKNEHDIDYKIANNISSKLGFKVNNIKLDKNFISWNLEDILFNEFYSKLGFHKQFYLRDKFFVKPQFCFKGNGGEFLRGEPKVSIKKFIKILSLKNIKGYKQKFYNSTEILLNRSVSLLKKEKKFNNDYEITSKLYSTSIGKYHFGKASFQCFMANIYNIQPLMDPEIRKIKFEISNKTSHDLIAYIYIRLAKELINFPFQRNRILNFESIKKAIKLNSNFKPYKRKIDYNKNFYIDKYRKSPARGLSNSNKVYEYLEKLFNSSNNYNNLGKIYNNNVIDWANDYMKKTNFFPFSQHYALLAIEKTLNLLSLNKK